MNLVPRKKSESRDLPPALRSFGGQARGSGRHSFSDGGDSYE